MRKHVPFLLEQIYFSESFEHFRGRGDQSGEAGAALERDDLAERSRHHSDIHSTSLRRIEGCGWERRRGRRCSSPEERLVGADAADTRGTRSEESGYMCQCCCDRVWRPTNIVAFLISGFGGARGGEIGLRELRRTCAGPMTSAGGKKLWRGIRTECARSTGRLGPW